MKKSHHKENYHYNPVHTNLNVNENRKNAFQNYITYIQIIQKNPYIFFEYSTLQFNHIEMDFLKSLIDIKNKKTRCKMKLKKIMLALFSVAALSVIGGGVVMIQVTKAMVTKTL